MLPFGGLPWHIALFLRRHPSSGSYPPDAPENIVAMTTTEQTVLVQQQVSVNPGVLTSGRRPERPGG